MSVIEETESEANTVASDSGTGLDAVNFASLSMRQARDLVKDTPILEAVRIVVSDLISLNPRRAAEDESIHLSIQQASHNILRFLELFCSSSDLPAILPAFIEILQHPLMERLLQLRKFFRSVALQEENVKAGEIITWVDVVLAKVSAAIMRFVTGVNVSSVNRSLEPVWNEDTLRACTQLPDEWSSVSTVLSSHNSSPALSRTAVRLLYGVWVVGSNQNKPPISEGYIKQLAYIMATHIQQIAPSVEDVDCNTSRHDEKIRIHYAMVLGLLVACESMAGMSIMAAQFRPLTLDSCIRCIRHIMHPFMSDSEKRVAGADQTKLDEAQGIVLSDPRFIPWCWSQWADSRIADMEVLFYVTIVWLNQLDTQDDLQCDCVFDDLASKYPVMAQAFVELIQYMTVSASSYAITITSQVAEIAKKAALGLIQVLFLNQGSLSSNQQSRLGYNILLFSVSMSHSIETTSVKRYLLEVLTLLYPSSLQDAVQQVEKDKDAAFITLLNCEISNAIDEWDSSTDAEHAILSNRDSTPWLLEILSILWRAGGGDRFISSAARLLSRICQTSGVVNAKKRFHFYPIQDAYMTALCSLEARLPNINVEGTVLGLPSHELVWELVSTTNERNLSWAAVYASYIMVTAPSLTCKVDTFAATWSFLADVMFLIVTGHFDGDEEPLSLLIVPNICNALISLLQSGVVGFARYLGRSPWTFDLASSIRAILDDHREDQFTSLLRDRLHICGKQLLEQINVHLNSNEEGYIAKASVGKKGSIPSGRWIYYTSVDTRTLIHVEDAFKGGA